MRNSRTRQSSGNGLELVNRGAHLSEGTQRLLGGRTGEIDSLDRPPPPSRELRLDKPAQVGGDGDPLAECCLPEREPLIVGDSDTSDVGMARHKTYSDTCRTWVQVCNWSRRRGAAAAVGLRRAGAEAGESAIEGSVVRRDRCWSARRHGRGRLCRVTAAGPRVGSSWAAHGVAGRSRHPGLPG